MAFKQTPSQTVGPYFAYGLTAEQYRYPGVQIASGILRAEQTPGTHIRIVGRVLDGEGVPIPDAMVEIWQADADGNHVGAALGNTGFCGFGRQGTGIDPESRFVFATVKPGPVDGKQAPHINVIVFMRGLLTHVYTRLYFPDEEKANAQDPVLAKVPEPRRRTLIARRAEGQGEPVYLFDIHMQGQDETVFFDV